MAEVSATKDIGLLEQEMWSAIDSGHPLIFFNNFIFKFPHPKRMIITRNDEELKKTKNKDLPFSPSARHSDKFLNQTGEEFSTEIDSEAAKLGYSQSQIEKMVTSPDKTEFYRRVAPYVFIAMIKSGYNQEDLKE